MVGYEYDGIATVKNAIELPYVSNRYGAKANVSKGMGFWESTFKLTGNYSLYKSKQLINSLPVDYKSQYWSANLVYSATPLLGWEWLLVWHTERTRVLRK